MGGNKGVSLCGSEAKTELRAQRGAGMEEKSSLFLSYQTENIF